MLERACEQPSQLTDSQAAASAQNLLRREIDLQLLRRSRGSYLDVYILDKAFEYFCPSERKALQDLRQLREETQAQRASGIQVDLDNGKTAQRLESDRAILSSHAELMRQIAGALKSVPLFLRGPKALIGAAVLYALDQASPADNFRAQAADIGLGGLKGLATKAVFESVGNEQNNVIGKMIANMGTTGIAVRGVALGTTSRIIDEALTRRTLVDSQGLTNWSSVATELSKVWSHATNTGAIFVDGAIFLGSHCAIGAANSASGETIANSPFWKTTLTGTTYGMTSGAISEIYREVNNNEGLHPWEIASRSLVSGVLNTMAALPGARQASGAVLRPASEAMLKIEDSARDPANDDFSKNERNAITEQKDWQSLVRLAKRFAGYSRVTEHLMSPIEGAGPFKDYSDFLWRGQGFVRLKMRCYNIDGHPETKFLVSERDSNNFAKLKALRFLNEQSANVDVSKLSAEKQTKLQELIRQSRELEQNPLCEDMPPEQAVRLLDEAPDSRLVNKLLFLKSRHKSEPWFKQVISDKVSIEGEAVLEMNSEEGRPLLGRITMYQPKTYTEGRNTFLHEWAHLAKKDAPVESALFDEAGSIEPTDIFNDPRSGHMAEEEWARMLGEHILSENPMKQLIAIGVSPVRASILGRYLTNVLENVPESQRSVKHDQYIETVRTIEQRALPAAVQKLSETIDAGPEDSRTTAVKILQYLKSDL
jgi:hypothetical protein